MNKGPGPLRNGNPRGNPDLAPRCGAACRTRMGLPCRSPAMTNGRCRMHGGAATGPRTEAGRQRLRDTHTIHGFRAARPPDPFETGINQLLRRGRVMEQLAHGDEWPDWDTLITALPPFLDAGAPDPALRVMVEATTQTLFARWRAERDAAAEKNTPRKTPCTVTTPTDQPRSDQPGPDQPQHDPPQPDPPQPDRPGHRLKPEYLVWDPRKHGPLRILTKNDLRKTPCTVDAPALRGRRQPIGPPHCPICHQQAGHPGTDPPPRS